MIATDAATIINIARRLYFVDSQTVTQSEILARLLGGTVNLYDIQQSSDGKQIGLSFTVELANWQIPDLG